jgi:hypothetical protein
MVWGREAGLVEDVAGRSRLTSQGRLLANEVFRRLLPPHGPAIAGALPACLPASA